MSRAVVITRKPQKSEYKPILRVFVLAYLSASVPNLFALSVTALRGRTAAREALVKAVTIIRRPAAIDRFPACAALIVAVSTGLPRLVAICQAKLGLHYDWGVSIGTTRRGDATLRFVGAFLAALLSFSLLNRHASLPIASGKTPLTEDSSQLGAVDGVEDGHKIRRMSNVAFGSAPPAAILRIPPLAGRTMDLTTFGITHAAVILSITLLNKCKEGQTTKALRWASEHVVAPTAFISSSFVIMWAFFYSPGRLPRKYNTWIRSAAQIDGRLLEALRQCRYGNFVYGKDTGLAPLLGNMARELGFPEEWGDPAKTIPVPEALYHSGMGKSCEWHALRRFIRAWGFAMQMYVPLNVLMQLRRTPSKRSFGRAFLEASQSSAFLGAFISLFYYGVCCGRCRIGPNLLGTDNVSRQMIDGGICVGAGCVACGGSIFLEKAPRRPELALWMTSRALSTILPRRYDRKNMWHEQLAFALSAATIITAAQKTPDRVKGVFGRLLSNVFQ